MRKTITTVVTLAAGLPAAAVADVVGVSVGAGVWNQEPSGEVRYRGDRVDVEDDLSIDSEMETFVWADLRHGVPLLPRLRLQYTPVDLSGDGSLVRSIEFGGQTFTGSEDVASQIELEQTDVALYWTPWSTVVDLDLGVNIKYLDGRAEVDSQDRSRRESVEFSGPVPMAYAATEARLPGTGLFGGASGSYVTFDGSELVDIALRAGYRADLGAGSLALEGGWKYQNLELDDLDDVDADITIEGPYAGISARF